MTNPLPFSFLPPLLPHLNLTVRALLVRIKAFMYKVHGGSPTGLQRTQTKLVSKRAMAQTAGDGDLKERKEKK